MKIKNLITAVFLLLYTAVATAQTDVDAIMMPKQNFCAGLMYSHSNWKNYWEGTYKRDNGNIGTLSTQMVGAMGNYGVSDKLNVLFSIPYVRTKASAGTLRGMKGIQDFSLLVKYMPVEKEWGPGTFSLYAVGGISLPVTNYVVDYLPLSIGLRSRTASLRLMTDYQVGSIFATLSAAYIFRDNIKIDRAAYYTEQMHYSNEVKMPNAANLNARAGYRSSTLIAEVVLDVFKTYGGFDIRKNDMPFPSNTMNAARLGINAKYTLSKPAGLSVIAGGNYVMSGRNVGQSTTLYTGVFYIMNWMKKKKPVEAPKK